jgi:hypothetical protein
MISGVPYLTADQRPDPRAGDDGDAEDSRHHVRTPA